MPNLYGRAWTRDELRARVGRIEQIAGVTRMEGQESMERGVELCEIRTGSGFRALICPSRGLDIVMAEHNGRPLCWNSSTGVTHPAFYNESNAGWLRGFAGGLLTTCGFSSFGPECADEGEQFGIHDRASYLPASQVAARSGWNGDEFEMEVSGLIRETRVFGPNLSLQRRISARLGDDFLTVEDLFTNDGFAPTPFIALYHCNFGFPVVSEHSRVHLPSRRCTPRDEAAQQGADQWMQLEPPQPDYAERVYFHDVEPDDEGWVRADLE